MQVAEAVQVAGGDDSGIVLWPVSSARRPLSAAVGGLYSAVDSGGISVYGGRHAVITSPSLHGPPRGGTGGRGRRRRRVTYRRTPLRTGQFSSVVYRQTGNYGNSRCRFDMIPGTL